MPQHRSAASHPTSLPGNTPPHPTSWQHYTSCQHVRSIHISATLSRRHYTSHLGINTTRVIPLLESRPAQVIPRHQLATVQATSRHQYNPRHPNGAHTSASTPPKPNHASASLESIPRRHFRPAHYSSPEHVSPFLGTRSTQSNSRHQIKPIHYSAPDQPSPCHNTSRQHHNPFHTTSRHHDIATHHPAYLDTASDHDTTRHHGITYLGYSVGRRLRLLRVYRPHPCDRSCPIPCTSPYANTARRWSGVISVFAFILSVNVSVGSST